MPLTVSVSYICKQLKRFIQFEMSCMFTDFSDCELRTAEAVGGGLSRMPAQRV